MSLLRTTNQYIPQWATDFLIKYGRYNGANGGQWKLQDS